MNEAETIAELIDPKIKEAGWGKVTLNCYGTTNGFVLEGST